MRAMGGKKRFWLNLSALAVGLLIVGAVEGVLRLIGVPAYSQIVLMRLWGKKPISGRVFSLQTDSTGKRIYVTSEKLCGLKVNPQSFEASKPPDTFRVFCFGGSTTYGFPVGDKVSFSRWMREFLNAECPGKRFEIVNCGILGMDSSGVLALMRECLAYQPDLFVVLCGHNERVRIVPKSLLGFFEGSRAAHRFRLLLARNLRIYSVLAQLWGRLTAPEAPEEMPVQTVAHKPTLKEKERNDRVIQFEFDCNLQAMADLARDANVGLIFVAPCPNFRDCSPVGSIFDPNLTQQQKDALLAQLWRAQVLMDNHDIATCEERLDALVARQPNYALFHYWLARCHERAGQFDLAKKEYLAALDTEWCGTRMTPALLRTMQQVAERNSVPFVDLFAVFASQSPHGLVGNNLIIDNCHPTIDGQKIVAKAILKKAISSGLIPDTCNIDRFDRIVQRFDEQSLLDNSDRARIAKWMAQYFFGREEFRRSADWLKRAMRLDPYDPTLQKRLAEIQKLTTTTATASTVSPN